MEQRFKKLVVISKDHKLANGSTFKSFFTPLKVNGEEKERLVTIKFERTIDTRKLPRRFICIVKAEDLSLPKSFNTYEKNGKTKYPYIFINAIEKMVECNVEEKKEVTAEFVVDEDIEEIVEDLSND